MSHHIPTIPKDPDATWIYEWDWSRYLPTGVTINTASVTSEDTAATSPVTVDTSAASTTSVSATLSGGEVGDRPTVVCEVNLTNGETDLRRIRLEIQEM